MSETVQQIRDFIFENLLFDAKEDDLNNDDSFRKKKIIDSTGVLELLEWIEEVFGFKVDDAELLPENLDSVNRLAAFIKKKTVK